MQGRLAALRTTMAAEGIDTLLVSDRASIRWLTGFRGSAGHAWVSAADAVLVTDDRYVERAGEEAPGWAVMTDRSWGWLGEVQPSDTTLAVEADVLTWATVQQLQDLMPVTPSTGLVAGLRQVKDDHEIALLRRACAITSEAFELALAWLRPGLTEVEVARRLVAEMLQAGADAPAFPPIVASGPNGSRPHHEPGDRKLRPGDLVTMDFGALVGGYHADMTRTVGLGTLEPALVRIHDLVTTAQQAGVDAALAGTATADVDRACRQVIGKAGHAEHFSHGTGHGVGLGLHEAPLLAATSTGTLSDRMTVTVEPGVYVPGFGGTRIEDVVLISPDGADRLTTAPRPLIQL